MTLRRVAASIRARRKPLESAKEEGK